MADAKQASSILSGGEEMEIEEGQTVDKTLRRTISAPSANNTESVCDSVFSPMIIASSYQRNGSLNGFETPPIEQMAASRRPKSTSSCRSGSSVSDDDQSRLSPHIRSRRTRTYSDSLNVDCGSASPSPSPIPIGSPAPRVLQIRREESVDEMTREAAKERDSISAISLSRSWDETSWLGGDKNFALTNESRDKRDSLDELVFAATFSPSLSSPVRFIDKLSSQRSLTPSPIGVPLSPNQRKYRRSLSPSSLRPSLLTSKRKLDPDDPDSFSSPAKRSSLFYSPMNAYQSHNNSHSVSSSSSPDHPSDSNNCSCDEDSGSEPAFVAHAHTTTTTVTASHTPVNSPLLCDTKSSFAFVKPRYVAPQSPLAAGVGVSGVNAHHHTNEAHRKSTLVSTSYTFTPVKET